MGKNVYFFLLGYFIEIYRRGMAETAVLYKPFGLFYGLFKIFRLVHGEHRREFLMRKFFGKLYAFDLTYQYLCVFGDLYARQLGYRVGGLSYNLGVERAVYYDGFADLFGLIGI